MGQFLWQDSEGQSQKGVGEAVQGGRLPGGQVVLRGQGAKPETDKGELSQIKGQVGHCGDSTHIDTALAGLGGGGRPGVVARSWPLGIWNLKTTSTLLSGLQG